MHKDRIIENKNVKHNN